MTKEEIISYGKDYFRDLETACCSISDIHKEFVREAIKALEQQPSNEDVQRVVDYLLRPISKPPTTSKDCVSLGVCKQVVWERDTAIEQLKELGYELGEKIRTSDDCVSREQAKIDVIPNSLYTSEQVIDLLDNLPPVTPTHGTCKDCTNYVVGALDEEICIRGHELIHKDFYCADFEKRGNENENN